MYRIVIVEDETKIREGIVNLFPWHQLGFEIAAQFDNGEKVLAYIEAGNPVDVVMTDIQMPNMDGIVLSEKLVKYRIKVVFFSSYQKFSYAQSAIINQVVDYIVKPVSYEKVYQCMERIAGMLAKERPEKNGTGSLEENMTEGRYKSIVRSVICYIEEYYAEATLEEAARRVHLTPSYLSKLFKENMGKTFSEHLSDVRMKNACVFLKNRDYKLYEIAGRVGYDNPKNFTRAFKNYYGISPQEYRNQKLLS